MYNNTFPNVWPADVLPSTMRVLFFFFFVVLLHLFVQTIAQVTTLSLYMRPCIIIKEVLSQMCYIINEHWKQYRLSRNRADVAATNLASNNYAGSGTLQDGVSSPLKWADCPKVFVSARIIVA